MAKELEYALSIDPSFSSTGYAIFCREKNKDVPYTVVGYGSIKTKSKTGFGVRTSTILAELSDVFDHLIKYSDYFNIGTLIIEHYMLAFQGRQNKTVVSALAFLNGYLQSGIIDYVFERTNTKPTVISPTAKEGRDMFDYKKDRKNFASPKHGSVYICNTLFSDHKLFILKDNDITDAILQGEAMLNGFHSSDHVVKTVI